MMAPKRAVMDPTQMTTWSAVDVVSALAMPVCALMSG